MSLPITSLRDENDRTGYTIEAVSTESGLQLLETAWNRLSESAEPRNVFSTFGWFLAWSRQRALHEPGEGFRPEVLVFRRQGAVAGIAPLIRKTISRFGFRVRRLEFVTLHADYNQLVLGEDRAGLTAALIEFLARTPEQWDAVDLRDLPEVEEGTELVKKALIQSRLQFCAFEEGERCPYFILDGGAEHQLARLSGHARQVLRKRSAQALSESMRVRIIEHPEREPGLLETMVSLEHKKSLHREFPPFLAPHTDVFRFLFESLGPRGWLYVALLEQNTEPIAFQLGFRCGHKLWEYNKAYDRAYVRLGPGKLLLLALFDYGFAHGYREYDFLRGEEVYKRQWSTGFHQRSRILIWNDRWKSQVYAALYRRRHAFETESGPVEGR